MQLKADKKRLGHQGTDVKDSDWFQVAQILLNCVTASYSFEIFHSPNIRNDIQQLRLEW